MKKSLLLLFAAFATLAASSQTKIEIEGIWYNLNAETKQAEVTYKGNSYNQYKEYSFAITIPSTVTYEGVNYSVTSIGNYAFHSCSSLTDVYCYAERVYTTNSVAFYNSNIKNATLHVPASALNDYKSSEPWRSFGNIVALTEEEMSVEQLTDSNIQMINYDLCGRRVDRIEQGSIYIVNGKKVVMK